jgi:hypothetical protein
MIKGVKENKNQKQVYGVEYFPIVRLLYAVSLYYVVISANTLRGRS